MLITIDVRLYNQSGIGTYLKNILPALINHLKYEEFLLLISPEDEGSMPSFDNATTKVMNSKIYSISEQFEFKNHIPKDTKLFWSPHYNIPILYRGKMIVTVHDVFHLAMKRYTDSFLKQQYARIMFNQVVRKASKIICVSKFTSDELNQHITSFKDASKVKVISNGIDFERFNFNKPSEVTKKNPYLLYVGNIKPHKNLMGLLRAFEEIKDTIPHDLIIVGKKEGFITGDDEALSKAINFNGRVSFTGKISDELLMDYYKGADVFIFPSFYEGFGLPPLEAMACGCPTVVSSSASIPEVCGEASLYFDPYNSNDIAAKINMILSDDDLKDSLRKKGFERAKQFSWRKSINETLLLFQEAIKT